MLGKKKKVNRRRMLITVNIVGSSGPLRFMVNEDDVVSDVILNTLKSYGRLRRFPLLGSDANHFLLYSSNLTFDVLSPTETIGSCGVREFTLRKKEVPEKETRTLQIKHETNNQNSQWHSKFKSFFMAKSKVVHACFKFEGSLWQKEKSQQKQ